MWEKIVLNLISNAFKFTLTGEIEVELKQAAGHAYLSVRDTGMGIPAHEIDNIFARFHRVEGARGRSQEGTGIGLALVQELVTLHGGWVRVKAARKATEPYLSSGSPWARPICRLTASLKIHYACSPASRASAGVR